MDTTSSAWTATLSAGNVGLTAKNVNSPVWPVRGGGSSGYSDPWKTGQTTSYATGDDGELQQGVAWPSPRFTDNGDGTVTDNLTGLMWLKDASCFKQNWITGLSRVADFNTNPVIYGCSGYTASHADWRVPNNTYVAYCKIPFQPPL